MCSIPQSNVLNSARVSLSAISAPKAGSLHLVMSSLVFGLHISYHFPNVEAEEKMHDSLNA